MGKAQQPGMQGLSLSAFDILSQRFWQFVELGFEALAIFGVSHEGMADMGHMHADLVGSARFELAFNQ